MLPTSTFDIKNDGASDLLLYLEPEGAKFSLPPQGSVQVHLFGSEKTVELNQSIDAEGRIRISLWPINGDYEVLFNGKSVWDQL